MTSEVFISDKVGEITDELKRLHLWKPLQPEWVTDFEKKIVSTEQDFLEWLQFVYLPNCCNQSVIAPKKLIVPQVVEFFGEDARKGKLLQLLIELDSL